MTGQKALAFLWALVWTLSPPILSHGYVFLTEMPSALVALLVYSRLDDVNGERPRRRGLLLGVLTGLLVLIHVRNIGLVLALARLIAWRVRTRPLRGAGFAAGLAVMGAIKMALNVQFWGTRDHDAARTSRRVARPRGVRVGQRGQRPRPAVRRAAWTAALRADLSARAGRVVAARAPIASGCCRDADALSARIWSSS